MAARTVEHFHTLAIVTVLFISSLLNANSLPCDDSRCKTGTCNNTGACICDLPNPATILDGDRPFSGGKYCDEEMTMCDGTNDFWCENGGVCEEIIQGEKYECKCSRGYKGKNCEQSGVACGQMFCYNQGRCFEEEEGYSCDCPPDWKGSEDCSLPTDPQTGSSTNSTTTGEFSEEETGNNTNWTVVALAFSCSVGAVGGGAFCAKRLLRKKEQNAATRFQQLSHMQSSDVLDENEADSMIPANVVRH